MKVKTLIRFTDLKEDTIREVGDTFEATKGRLEELLLVSSDPLVEVVIEKATTKEDIERKVTEKAVNKSKKNKK